MIDILVNNAGRTQVAEWVKTSIEVDREMLETNVLGPLSLTKAVLPDMMARRDGHVVVMSSGAGKFGYPLCGSYNGSKHALQGWFEGLRIEQYSNNIKVTMVCPGPVFSNKLAIAMTEEKGKVVGGQMKPEEMRMATSRCAALTAVAIANQLDEIDILVNNAGRTQVAEWVKTSIEVDREMLETNVLGPLSLTKAVLPDMIARRDGHVVVMSSGAGKFGYPLCGSYNGSKHALQGWFEGLRIEQYSNNIKVTMVCPGPVFSNKLAIAMTEEKGKVVGGQMKPEEMRMATSRCAALTAVAIANQLDEVWISLRPVLNYFYLYQYFPSFARRQICEKGFPTFLKKLRQGQ